MYAALLLLALESLREKKDRGAQRRANHFHVCVSRFSPTGANFVEGISNFVRISLHGWPARCGVAQRPSSRGPVSLQFFGSRPRGWNSSVA